MSPMRYALLCSQYESFWWLIRGTSVALLGVPRTCVRWSETSAGWLVSGVWYELSPFDSPPLRSPPLLTYTDVRGNHSDAYNNKGYNCQTAHAWYDALCPLCRAALGGSTLLHSSKYCALTDCDPRGTARAQRCGHAGRIDSHHWVASSD